MLTENMKSLIELEVEKGRLDEEIKKKKKIVLTEMTQNGLSDVDHNGVHIRLVESERNTIRDKTGLALFVKNKPALSSCVQTELKPDVEMLKLAVTMGNLSQADFDSFVKVSTLTSLKVGS